MTGSLIDSAVSDGRTPEEQVKQILQIAPILPGQTPDRRFSIPERHPRSEQVQPAQQQAQPSQQQARPVQPPAPQPQQQHGDLIDFGQHDTQRGVSQQQPSMPHQQPVGQTQIPQSQPAQSVGANRVARKDSETAEFDEFVDAES